LANRFGAYEIIYELKSGGMGAVLLGRRRGPGAFEQLVAIKTIRPEFAATQSVRAMFLDEAAILARLNHPGVATVHDFGEEVGTLYMVMEYVAGLAFRDVVEMRPPPAVAARAIVEACRGLHAAHELRDLSGTPLGLVHRDVSPDNLMLGYDGHVKVIDFGIALVKNRQAPVTEFGTVKGKPPYMSPEQVKNDAMDRRSDVFSLAVVLWEMLTNRPLFEGDSIYAIARAVEHQEIQPPSVVIGSDLPAGLDAAVMDALIRDPTFRTPTAAAFAEQLEMVINAAGDETLESWADRELREPREAHRMWLARVVAGRDTPKPIVGRATGSVTELAPVGKMSTLPAAPEAGTDEAGRARLWARPAQPVAPPSRDDILPGQSTHIPAAGEDSYPQLPRRRLAIPLLALLLLAVLGIGTAIFLMGRKSEAVHDAGPTPPAPDATIIVVAPEAGTDAPIDALPDAALDAAVDARTVHQVHDAGPRHKDAAVPLDATVTAAAGGTGFLRVPHPGEYLNVILDGELIGPTPIMTPRKIPAGTHTIKLQHPSTNEVVLKRTITVRDGETVTIE